jgi:predicted dehydrogenase
VNQLRGLLVGCGNIASSHMNAWRRLDSVRIEAVCDLDHQRARRLARNFGLRRTYTDLSQALASVRPHFVDLATGPTDRLEIVTQAIASGCHVLCQKPLATTLEAARNITNIAASTDRVVAVNEMWKWLPGYALAREVVSSGAVGQVRMIRLRHACNLLLPRSDGGVPERLEPHRQPYFAVIPQLILFDFGVHCIDLLRSMFGPAKVIVSAVSNLSPFVRGEDAAFVKLRFDSGPLAELFLDWSMPGEPHADPIDSESLAIAGSGGLLTVEGARIVRWFPTNGIGWMRVSQGDRREQAFLASQRDFIEAIQKGSAPASPPSDHLENLRIVFQAYKLAGLSE